MNPKICVKHIFKSLNELVNSIHFFLKRSLLWRLRLTIIIIVILKKGRIERITRIASLFFWGNKGVNMSSALCLRKPNEQVTRTTSASYTDPSLQLTRTWSPLFGPSQHTDWTTLLKRMLSMRGSPCPLLVLGKFLCKFHSFPFKDISNNYYSVQFDFNLILSWWQCIHMIQWIGDCLSWRHNHHYN